MLLWFTVAVALVHVQYGWCQGQGQACSDRITRCSEMGLAVCRAFPEWSAFYCPSMCRMCSTTGAATTQSSQTELPCCVDQIGWRGCLIYRQDSCQEPFRAFMSLRCQAFCGMCRPCPIEPCEDEVENCNLYGANLCTAEEYYIWAMTNCRQYCGLCTNYGYYNVGPSTQIPTTEAATGSVTSSGQTAGPTTASQQCQDMVTHCAEYGQEDCRLYPDFMGAYCAQYCGLCSASEGQTPQVVCEDVLDNCTHIMAEDCCGIYEPWARHYCSRTCGYCGVPPERNCQDTIDYCEREPADLCTSDRYRFYVADNCAGFCNLCDQPWTPPSCTANLFPDLVG